MATAESGLDDSIGEDYFDQQPGDDIPDHALMKMMDNEENRDIIQQYLGMRPSESTVQGTEHTQNTEWIDSEDEKDQKARRSDLSGFGEVISEYSENGQLELLNKQVNDMQKKKLEVRDKIKKFLDSTFDPIVFASISRLLTVKILAHHHHSFDQIHCSAFIMSCLSLLNPAELQLFLETKSIVTTALAKQSSDQAQSSSPEMVPLLKICLILIKELLLSYSEKVKRLLRKDDTLFAKRSLTSYELVCLLSSLLAFMGFRTRTGFLLSFDKLNLNDSYRLDMYGNNDNKNKGSDIESRIGEARKLMQIRNKNKRKIDLKREKSKGGGENDEEKSESGEWSAHSDSDSGQVDSETGEKVIKKKKRKSDLHGRKATGRGNKKHQSKKSGNFEKEESNKGQANHTPKKKIEGERQVQKSNRKAHIEEVHCSFEHDEMSPKLLNLLAKISTTFGPDYLSLTKFIEKWPINKCFLEVYNKSDRRFKIVDLSKFDFVGFKNVFIQKLLHKTCTLFIYTLRKAKLSPVECEDPNTDTDDLFYNTKSLLKEVTPCFCNEKWSVLFRQQYQVNKSKYVKLPGILQAISELNKLNPYDLSTEELEFELKEGIEIETAELAVVPTRRSDFTYSRVYIISTRMRMSHVLRPDAVSIGKVDGIDIYKRRDLEKLYTKIQWRNRGFDILPNAKARKAIEITGWKTLEYFDETQITPLRIELNRDGTIPMNDYGNIEIMHGLPPKTVHIDNKGIKIVMKQMKDIEWVPAVKEFEFRNGRFFPIISGVVIHERDREKVMEEYERKKAEIEKREEGREGKFMDQLWKEIFKTLYTKKYFAEKANN